MNPHHNPTHATRVLFNNKVYILHIQHNVLIIMLYFNLILTAYLNKNLKIKTETCVKYN